MDKIHGVISKNNLLVVVTALEGCGHLPPTSPTPHGGALISVTAGQPMHARESVQRQSRRLLHLLFYLLCAYICSPLPVLGG